MDTRQLVRLALLTALVAIATLAMKISIPATEGYINVAIPLLSWLLYWLVDESGDWLVAWVRRWPTSWEGILIGFLSLWLSKEPRGG